ncbi:MAG TPA: hypothetical protein VI197_10215 [Polyangiaceae bacterium]
MENPPACWRAGVVAGTLAVALGCGAGTPSEPKAPGAAPSVALAPQRSTAASAASEPNRHAGATGAGATGAGATGAGATDAGELGAREPAASSAATRAGSAHSAKVESSRIETECHQLCASAAESCSRKSARECRANCGKYQSLADRCEVQVLGAIRCQAAVPKLVCSNVTSECTTEFQALSACEDGEPSAAAATAPSQPPLPPGWMRVRDTEAGFEVALPLGARVGELEGRRTWTAEGADGASYRVAILPAVGVPATEKRLMEAVLHYLGHECQPLLRLHGRFETERDVAERFNARCEDGQRWRGILRASREQLVLVVEVLPPDVQATGDIYYYSFEYLK